MPISSFQELKPRLRGTPPKCAVVAAAHDEHTLQAVFAARRVGLIRPILVGREEEIRALAQTQGEALTPDQIVDAESEEDCARQSVALIREGRGDMLIKGMLQTGTLMKAAVSREEGIRAGELLSHVAILDVPRYHKLLFITDGGMVVAPTLEQKRHILKNAVDFCRRLGYDRPKAAILCAVENVTDTMPETVDAAQLKRESSSGAFGPCVVEGPISLDLATDREAARIKRYSSPVAGDADILLAPSISAGNFLGKALYGLAGGQMAGVVLGARVPITVNSRGASAQERYSSIVLCATAGGEGGLCPS